MRRLACEESTIASASSATPTPPSAEAVAWDRPTRATKAPEIDAVAYFDLPTALCKILPGQRPILIEAAARMAIPVEEVDSIVQLVHSQIDVSLARIL